VGGEGNGGQQSPPLSVEAIREQLQQMEAIRRELDEAALRREQLGQMGAELCAQPGALGAAQQQAVRLPLAELNQRWNRLYGQLGDSQHRLERALLDMGQFAQAHAQLLAWLEKTAATLGGVDPAPAGGLKHVEIELCKLRVLLNDIGGHQPSFEAILATGRQMQRQDPQCAADTQQKMDLLGQRWAALGQQAEQLWAQLEKARAEAASRGNDLDRWQLWLDDLLAELKSSRPVGGLPETAEAQLDEFRIVKAIIDLLIFY
jgi:dystonin